MEKQEVEKIQSLFKKLERRQTRSTVAHAKVTETIGELHTAAAELLEKHGSEVGLDGDFVAQVVVPKDPD